MMKKALLVGINAYPKGRLRGCLNDVAQMLEILTGAYDFRSEDIRVIKDGDATRAGIDAGIRWLAEGGPGSDASDVRVFHYSGHGSYVADQNGDEADGRDECLVPVDYATNGTLIDDDLNKLYDLVPPRSNLTILADCCHSGTIDKDIERDIVYRFLPVDEREAQAIEQAREAYEAQREDYVKSELRKLRAMDDATFEAQFRRVTRAFDKRRKRLGDVSNREDNILLAGCTDIQTSADARIAGDYHGAFTYYLVEAWKTLGKTATCAAIAAELGKRIYQNGYTQTPQISGQRAYKDLPLFSSFGQAF